MCLTDYITGSLITDIPEHRLRGIRWLLPSAGMESVAQSMPGIWISGRTGHNSIRDNSERSRRRPVCAAVANGGAFEATPQDCRKGV